MVEERRSNLGTSFISVSIDVWTNPHRKEQFSPLVINFLAEKYLFFVGDKKKKLLMSRETKKQLIEDTFTSKSKDVSNLDFVFKF